MKKYYILSVDSFQDTFTKIDSTKTFSLEFTVQNTEDVLDHVEEGDNLLVYRRAPLSGANVYMNVVSKKNNVLMLKKELEVAKLVPICIANVNLEENYLIEISEEKFHKICKQMLQEIIDDDSKINENLSENTTDTKRLTDAENILLYGVPGVGKSHEIQEKYCDDASRMERIVFHPDYTYSDFVGQILPRVEEGQLKYVFTPGPFTKMLKRAWDNPGKEYYLVIEEINRGNAPAIFGEIFQLLDRKTEDSHKYDPAEYGESEYAISNYDVATVVFGKAEHEIRIPSNMWILATMNTADQNVFTLDTAFQRRWNMRHMKNDVMSAGHAKNKIEGTEIQWGAFAVVINDMVMNTNVDMASSEDKRLGAYFVKHSELSSNKFPGKVLKYLWDDAFRLERDLIFDENFKSLEDVIETYEEATTDKLGAVLKPEVYQKMVKEMQREEEN
ncbi:MAG: AAA family ATPase [Hespellia sp.]|nr:AAA family ATPase [Hespellia sp.]